MFESFLAFDHSVMQWVANVFDPGNHAFFDPFFRIITTLGDEGILFIALGLGFMIFSRTRKVGAIILLAMLIDVIIVNVILKNIFARPRPFHLGTRRSQIGPTTMHLRRSSCA